MSEPHSRPEASVFALPIARRLSSARRVLIAGAGGGFDVFAGLPLFHSLLAEGKEVFLANLSFTHLPGTTAARIGEVTWKIGPDSTGAPDYFPERYLAEWLKLRGLPSAIYGFSKAGVRPLRRAYEELAKELGIDTLILVDGGTDILMRGDEAGLGTPGEDMTSLAAARRLEVQTKIVTCLGFGIDAFHGVCHAHFLENVAALEAKGAYLGAHSLHLSMPHVAAFRDAVEYVQARMPDRNSIVNGSIVSALEGRFGDFHRSERTRQSTLFINPLMSLFWHFDLVAVADRSLYLHLLDDTRTAVEVQLVIEAFQETAVVRPRIDLPI